MLEEQIVVCRDHIARGYTQAIRRAENDANEIMPSIFPRGEEPFQSFDLLEWVDQILHGLIDILEGLGDIFDALDMDALAYAMDVAADALRHLDHYGHEQGWWGEE